MTKRLKKYRPIVKCARKYVHEMCVSREWVCADWKRRVRYTDTVSSLCERTSESRGGGAKKGAEPILHGDWLRPNRGKPFGWGRRERRTRAVRPRQASGRDSHRRSAIFFKNIYFLNFIFILLKSIRNTVFLCFTTLSLDQGVENVQYKWTIRYYSNKKKISRIDTVDLQGISIIFLIRSTSTKTKTIFSTLLLQLRSGKPVIE